jgi:hypothetical protein
VPRWTIRGVCPDTIHAVQAVQSETGAALGEIVSLCIAAGLDEARRQLVEQLREDDALALLIQEIRVSVGDMQRAISGLSAVSIDPA